MRVSLVICLALCIVMINCAVPKTTKAPKKQSAYAYLRSVRSKNSCASGTCAFWERHGRSFAALRCYSQQYKECVCLHRMCFSSCMFSRDVCNQEMAICLKQICPRCMPASSSSMCKVYDSMADQVAVALSVFACYPCCPNLANSPSNNTSNSVTNMIITTTPQIANNGNTGAPGNTNGAGAGSTTPIKQNANNSVNNGGSGSNTANAARPNSANGARQNNTNGNTANFGGVLPGSGMTNYNANVRNNTSGNNSANNKPVQNQQVRRVTRPAVTPKTTTRRKTVTTPRPKTTTRGNNNKSTVRQPVQSQKKPQF